MSGVERGPEPVSPLPWRLGPAGESFYDGSDYVDLGGNDGHYIGDAKFDAAAIVHRVNGWDALLAERDAAIARAEKVEGLLAEADGVVARLYREVDMSHAHEMPPTRAEARCIARHEARKGTP